MIKKLKATNFESWEKLSIKFDPGVNVIIGPSDRGKSGLIRTICWPLFNKPLGDAFRTWESDKTSSTITLDDKIKVNRAKTDNSNTYVISTYENDFKAFGANVPEEISKALKMEREINVQAQTDPIFLLSKSPGDVAKHFNKVAGLFRIDSTLKNAKQDITQTKTKTLNLKTSIEENQEELKQYDNLEEFNTLLIKCNKNQDYITESKEKVTNIQNIVHQIGVSLDLIKKLEAKYVLFPLVVKTIEKQEAIDIDKAHKQNLESKVNNIKNIKYQLRQDKKKYNFKNWVDNCLKIKKGVRKLKKDLRNIRSTLNTIEENNYQLTKLQDNHDILEIKFKEEMPDECPLCGK